MEKLRQGLLWILFMSFALLTEQEQIVSAHTPAGTVTGDHVNVREQPSLNASILGKVHSGEHVRILSSQDGWIQINHENGTAWVSGQYVQTEGTRQSAGSDSYVRIQTEGTNLRSSPSTSASIIVKGSIGERYPVSGRSGDWIKIRLASGNEAYVASWVVSSNEKAASSLEGKVIVLDPGHGGMDGGTSGSGGTNEKDVTMQTALKLADELTKSGATVKMTRTGDQFVPLPARTADAGQHMADAFISLHYDGTTNQSASGFTTYYYHDGHKKLARSVNQGLERSLPLSNRGTRTGDYFVLRENEKPAILLELGYLTNPNEESSIVSASYQSKAAAGIRDGLASYFTY